jgi:hypothetical protein
MYGALAHTGIGAAALTVTAICTTVAGAIVRRRARRAGRHAQQGSGK